MQIKITLLAMVFLAACASSPPCKGGLTHNCNNGDGGACYSLGSAVFGTISNKDNANPEETKDKAADWFKKGCHLGHQKSCQEQAKYKEYIKNGRN